MILSYTLFVSADAHPISSSDCGQEPPYLGVCSMSQLSPASFISDEIILLSFANTMHLRIYYCSLSFRGVGQQSCFSSTIRQWYKVGKVYVDQSGNRAASP